MQTVHLRAQRVGSTRDCLDREGSGVLDQLRTCLTELRSLVEMDTQASSVVEHFSSALAELEEASIELSRYVETVEYDPGRLTEVQERLADIASLRRK